MIIVVLVNVDKMKRNPKTFYEDAKKVISKFQLSEEIESGKNFEDISKSYNIKSKFISKMCKEYGVAKSIKNRTCIICGGKYKPYDINGKIYCYKHYQQIKQYGKILERTKFDLNEIIIYEDRAEIVLYDIYQKEKARAIIDVEDVEKVKNIKWHLMKTGYVYNKKLNIRLHHLVLGTKNIFGKIIDHANKNKLDNRKINLRLASNTENSINRTKSEQKSSEFIGVSYNKEKQKWESYIKVNKKSKKLGYFMKIEDAIKSRLSAEKLYFGEFAPQKNLFEEYGV